MGALRGSKKGVSLRKTPRWVPKSWKPLYDQMVLLSVSGKSNAEIAAEFGYTEQQVSNILRTPQSLRIKEKISEKLTEDFEDDLAKRIDKIMRRSVDNVEKVLFNDSLLESSPIAIIDRSMAFLKGVGKLTGDNEKTKIQNTIVIGADLQKVIKEGLEKSEKVKLLHGVKE